MKEYNRKLLAFILSVTLLFSQGSFVTLASNADIWQNESGEQNAILYQTPASSSEASVASSEVPASSSEAPVASSEAPVASSEAPASSSEAPASSSEAPVSSSEAPVSSSEAPVSSSEAPVSSSEAPVSSSEAPVSSSEAPVTEPEREKEPEDENVSSAAACTCIPELNADDPGHDSGCPFFTCDCGEIDGVIMHQPGCPAYVMSSELRELYELVDALPETEDIDLENVEDIISALEEISARYYALTAFDAEIFDFSIYLTKLLATNEAIYSAAAIVYSVPEPVMLQAEPAGNVYDSAVDSYSRLQQCLDTAASGKSIVLDSAFPSDEAVALTLSRDVELTLDLAGKTIEVHDAAAMDISAGRLTIQNGAVISDNIGAAVVISSPERLELRDALISNTNISNSAMAVSGAFSLPQHYIADYKIQNTAAISTINYSYDATHKYIEIILANDVSEDLSLDVADWVYGENESTPVLLRENIDVSLSASYTYSTALNGEYSPWGTFVSANHSTAGKLKAGAYYAKAAYIDRNGANRGVAYTSFDVLERAVTLSKGTLSVADKVYDSADSGAVISGAPEVESALDGDIVSAAVEQAAFADRNAGDAVAINAISCTFSGLDSGCYTLGSNVISGLTGRITGADGTLNPDYAGSLADMESIRIITNIMPTLADVTLPLGWSFTGNTSDALSGDAVSTLQSFGVKYTSSNPNYADVSLTLQLPVTTIPLDSGAAGGISEEDKAIIRATANRIRALSAAEKAELELEDIETLDALLKLINAGLDAGCSLMSAAEDVPAPLSVQVVGIALTGGIDSGAVEVRVTPVAASGNVVLKLDLSLLIDGSERQLNTPLFFTVELPETINISRLSVLNHILSDNSAERIDFEKNGRFVSFKLDSFSGVEFVVSAASGGSGGREHPNTQPDFWQQVEDAVNAAQNGDTVRVDAKWYDQMPVEIITAIKGRDVTLIISWYGGDTIYINGATLNITPEANRIYYPLALLLELLKNQPIAPSYDIVAPDNSSSTTPVSEGLESLPTVASSSSIVVEPSSEPPVNPSDDIVVEENPAVSVLSRLNEIINDSRLLAAACAVLLVLLIILMAIIGHKGKTEAAGGTKKNDRENEKTNK